MKARYEGNDGRRLLVEALKTQTIVQHNSALAEQLADAGTLAEFQVGETLAKQSDPDNSIFFILSGQASIFVNGRHVATRGPRETIGEMALLEPSAPRSATVSAHSLTTTLKVTEPAFQKIAESHPQIWKPLAQVVAERLRQRSQFHRAPNEKPVIFVGSSTEGLSVAKNIQLLLKHSPLDLRLWTSGVFGPSGIPIDDLLKQVDSCDFAAFVFGPDDKVASRGDEQNAPRDNVIFELGLFMGRVGRERAFLIKEHSTDLKIPSDLLGVTPITYVSARGSDLPAALGPVCTEIEGVVQRLGAR